jgi:hypothetical protein
MIECIGAPNHNPRACRCLSKSGKSITSGNTMLNQDFKGFRQSLNDNHVRYLARVEVDIEDTKVNFINLENLLKNKRASGRAQDLADLENL